MEWISLREVRIAVTAILVAWTLPTSHAARADEPPERGELRVARLVRELGASDFEKRESADENLATLGRQGREQLELARRHPDIEVRLRAERLLERLAMDDLWAGSPVNYCGQAEPVSQVFAAIAAQTGNRILIGDAYGSFADQPLDVDYNDVSFWQAVDDLCARTENCLRPHYDTRVLGTVVSTGDPGQFPRAYAGPVRGQITGTRRVFIEELNYEEPRADLTQSFQLNLKFQWEDRFRLVAYATQPVLISAVTDGGIEVASAQTSTNALTTAAVGQREVAASMHLNPVPISARAFDTFKVRWRVLAVGELATIEIDSPQPGKCNSRDDVALKVEAIDEQPDGRWIVAASIIRDLPLPEPYEVIFREYQLELLDQQGRAFRLQNDAHALTDRAVQLTLTFIANADDSQPQTLKLHYPRQRARRVSGPCVSQCPATNQSAPVSHCLPSEVEPGALRIGWRT